MKKVCLFLGLILVAYADTGNCSKTVDFCQLLEDLKAADGMIGIPCPVSEQSIPTEQLDSVTPQVDTTLVPTEEDDLTDVLMRQLDNVAIDLQEKVDTSALPVKEDSTDDLMRQLDDVAAGLPKKSDTAPSTQQKEKRKQSKSSDITVHALSEKFEGVYLKAFKQLCRGNPNIATQIADIVFVVNAATQRNNQRAVDEIGGKLKAIFDDLDPELKRNVQL